MKYRRFTTVLLIHFLFLLPSGAAGVTEESIEYNAKIVDRQLPEIRSAKLSELAREETRNLFAPSAVVAESAVDFFVDLKASAVLQEALPLLVGPTVKLRVVSALSMLTQRGDKEFVKALVREQRFLNEMGPPFGGTENKMASAEYQRALLREIERQTGLELGEVEVHSKEQVSAAIVRVEEWLGQK